MTIAADIFGVQHALIGMVHVGALPGTPFHGASVKEIAAEAVAEAKLLADHGFDALIIENMHDVPYLRREVGPEIVASMSAIAGAVREAVDIPLGIQILAGANRASLAVANAVGAQFIRAEGFVYATIADEGLMQADAGPLLRYRKMIGADHVRVLADVKKKHSAHAITQDVPIDEFTRAAEFFGADGVVVTGVATARPTDVNDLRAARIATKLPLIAGSGTTDDNVRDVFDSADAVIVGTWFKKDGDWSNPPDPARVKAIVAAADRARL